MAFATQLELERALHADFTTEPEPVVTQLLDLASGIIENFLQRRFDQTGIVEVHDGGEKWIQLDNYPVSAVVSVVEDGTALVITDDFEAYPQDGQLLRVDNGRPIRWCPKPRAVTVTYDAVLDLSTPLGQTLKAMCLQMCARAFASAAAWAALPSGSEALRQLTLAGSDSVTYNVELVNRITEGMTLTELETRQLAREARKEIA